MKSIKIFLAVLILMLLPVKTFADAPDISYGKMEFNFAKGYHKLTDNVRVTIDNHGFKMTLTANEAKVNMFMKKCTASGKVNLIYEDITFSCDQAYAEWDTNTANIVGKIDFNSNNTKITSDTATFNWNDRIADFYGNVKVKADKNVYDHVRYDVTAKKILQSDKNFDIPKIVIPDFDK